jgi:hypothetical protein
MRPRSRMSAPTWPLRCQQSARLRQHAPMASLTPTALAVAVVLGRVALVRLVQSRARMAARSSQARARAPAPLATPATPVRTTFSPGGNPKMEIMPPSSSSGSSQPTTTDRTSPVLQIRRMWRAALRSVEPELISTKPRALSPRMLVGT